MMEQNFNKIKKTVFILLAVFFVVAVTAASASACASDGSEEKTKEKPANVVDPKQAQEAAKKIAQEKLGNKLLDMVENNWFGNGGYSDNGWGDDSDNGWRGDSDNGWSDDDWFNGGW